MATPTGGGHTLGHVFTKAAQASQPKGTSGVPGMTMTKDGREVPAYKPPATAGVQLGNKKAKAASVPKNRAPKDFKPYMPSRTPEKMVNKAPKLSTKKY